MALGDHLVTSRLGYTHHGIDLGDGTVAHYSGLARGMRSGPVEIVSRDAFAAGRSLTIRVYRSRRYEPAEIAHRARSRVGEDLYRVDSYNCEHFATWCVTGRAVSRQVDHASVATGVVKAMGAGTGATTVVASSGTVAGLSGPGIMSGLAAIGPGGVVGGIVTLAGSAGLGSALLLSSTVLADHPSLDDGERNARAAGRAAAVAGAVGGTAAGVATVAAAGTTAGLSGAGLMSGLAAVGAGFGGGAAMGVAAVVAAPAVLATGLALAVCKLR
jgi:hypothetical protein